MDISRILLPHIWPIGHPDDYKAHFAIYNGEKQPLNVWVQNPANWRGWQEFRGEKEDERFGRPYIFSLMDFYPEKDVWLFGGVFRVLERHSRGRKVELAKEGARFAGRLKLRSDYRERPKRGLNFENHYDTLEVVEILPIDAVEDRETYWKGRLSG